MKNTFLLVAILLFAGRASAQISLEHTFSPVSQYGIVLFTDHGTKYYMRDTGTNSLKLYNTDYTLWKTIPLPAPTGASYYVIQQISDKLFNNDAQIELYVSWLTVSSSVVTYHGRVIDETGATLLDIPNGTWSLVFYIDGAHKFSVTMYGAAENRIYSVPGSLPCGHCGAGSVGVPRTYRSGGGTPFAMPNPSGDVVSIQHNIATEANGMLVITSMDGRTMGSYSISGSDPILTVDVKQFPSGTYSFSVLVDGHSPTHGTFVH